MTYYSAVKLETYAQDWRMEVCNEKRQEAGLGPVPEGVDPRETNDCDIPDSHFLVPSSYLTMDENQMMLRVFGRDLTLDRAETQALEAAINETLPATTDGAFSWRSYELWKYVKYAREGTDGYRMTSDAQAYYDSHFTKIKEDQWSRGGYALLPQFVIDYLKK